MPAEAAAVTAVRGLGAGPEREKRYEAERDRQTLH